MRRKKPTGLKPKDWKKGLKPEDWKPRDWKPKTWKPKAEGREAVAQEAVATDRLKVFEEIFRKEKEAEAGILEAEGEEKR